MRTGRLRNSSVLRLVALAWIVMFSASAWAGGGRFVVGMNWGVPAGWNAIWSTGILQYYTDPGPLSRNVSHAQADAMVAAAAAVWNVPTSSISLSQGGELAEDVSSENTYLDGDELVFPADVQSSNEGNVPFAILYDADGRLIEMLLGEGASDPLECRQNAVVGDVDDIYQSDGSIDHAVLILNGRCVSSAPEQITEMQYQLTRAMGRVLGLSWSQTNDNVFTAQTTVTANQMAFWPVMHPIDVICGNYSYQCMTNPFTLRVDDLNTLADVYPVFHYMNLPNKQGSIDGALWFWGILYFPTGQGMDWVNVTTRRLHNGFMEDWETTSGITGNAYEQATATPTDNAPAVNSGGPFAGQDGYFSFRRVPLDGISNVYMTSEPINPLYTGDYAIGPYVRPPATPSGLPTMMVDWSALPAGDQPMYQSATVNGAAASCDPGEDGSESAPASLDPGGWQNGLLCGEGHSSWWNVPVSAGHTWTLEVTATDETGASTTYKAQPTLGIWNGTDPTGTLPTVASQNAPFNSMSLGMTQMHMDGADADGAYRVVVTDQFGGGRPDFTYVARVLYAATAAPATLGTSGGQITITGTGFRQGNQLLINGVPAHVLSWSATQIVADAPPMAAAEAQNGDPVDVTVFDASTGGTATIPAAVTYTAAPDVLRIVSAPAALETGVTAQTAFAVRVLTSDGISPVTNAAVRFSVSAGSAELGICAGQSACMATTDATGLVQTTVTGGAAGPVTLSATEQPSGVTVDITLVDTDPTRSVSIAGPTHFLAAGVSDTWAVTLTAQQDGTAAPGSPVSWNWTIGSTLGNANSQTGADGLSNLTVAVTALAAGETATVQGCAWTSVCANWTVTGVDPSQWLLQAPTNVPLSAPASSTIAPVTFTVVDTEGHPVERATVQVYQRVLAWEGSCAKAGRCAAAPVLTTSRLYLTSDGNGQVSFAPLQIAGIPQVIEVAVATGTQGFLALTLVKAP